jgi:hypothetical protein
MGDLTLIQAAIKKCIEWGLQVLCRSQSGTQPPGIAMQRIWTAGQENIASGLKFRPPFMNKKNITKSQNFTKVQK